MNVLRAVLLCRVTSIRQVHTYSYLQQLQDGLVSVLLVLDVSVLLFWVLTMKMYLALGCNCCSKLAL